MSSEGSVLRSGAPMSSGVRVGRSFSSLTARRRLLKEPLPRRGYDFDAPVGTLDRLLMTAVEELKRPLVAQVDEPVRVLERSEGDEEVQRGRRQHHDAHLVRV